MDAELMLDVGQANEFKLAMRKHGWTNADLKKFCEGDMMRRVLSVIRGQADIVSSVLSATVEEMSSYIIDCDAYPFLRSGWKFEEHKKGGQFIWNIAKVSLYLSLNQQNGDVVKGHDLRHELKNQPVLNACVLDYLLAHPELIPEEWKEKEKYIFFWGTIYRNSDDKPCVRYLYWSGSKWCWGYYLLRDCWAGRHPAVVLASVPA